MVDPLALSVRQPWAWALIYGGKAVENRAWRSSYRGALRIHASKTFDAEGYEWIETAVENGALHLPRPLPAASELLFGGVIGSVHMIGCMESLHDELATEDDEDLDMSAALAVYDLDFERNVEDWWAGPYGFLLGQPTPARFQPCRGMPGMFRPQIAPAGTTA